MAAAVTLPYVHERTVRYSSSCPSTLVPGHGRRLRRRTWLPRKGFAVRAPSEPAHGSNNVWQGSGGRSGGHDTEHGGRAPSHLLPRRAAEAISITAADGDGWKWQEPVIDGSLSTADRAVLALARAAANLADKLAAERAAAAHGLALVTSSDVCVGPLLPPFGFTMEDDGEEGDGMAPPAPASAPAPRRLAGETPRRQGGGSTTTTTTSSSLAGGASALLSAMFAGSGTRGAAAEGADGAVSAAAAGGGPGLHRAPRIMERFSNNGRGGGGGGASSADDKLRNLARMVAEGGGGDESEGEETMKAFAAERRGGGSGGGDGGDGGAQPSSSSSSSSVGEQRGIMGVAAAVLTRVARAASSTAADAPAAPVGRAAAGAAAAAAQAAVATAARATAHMLPHHGDPTSSWLVADDPAGGVRYIVVAAGPDLRRRTARELTADLVNFETYNLGIKVNKRLYNEASALYARFMPLVMDFLEAVPDGNVCFGGQGVGGSLAVLLQLMCVHRGLRFARLLPAVAVDSPTAVGQVPREQRRQWGHGGSREQQRQLPQDSLEDVVEDLMQRSVLEELGLPHDAVRNLLLPPPTQSAATPSPWYGTGHVQNQEQDWKHSHATGPMLVLAAAGAAAGGDGGRGGSGTAAAHGAAAAATVAAAGPQIFRMVGKVVHVETIGSLNVRAASHASASSWSAEAMVTAAAAVAAAASGGSMDAAIVEADGGSGEVAAVAAAALGSSGGGLAGAARRLDVATVGSIATAAATAAASAAAAQLRHVGAGALRVVTAADKGRAAAAAAATAAAAPVGAAAAAAIRRAQWSPLAAAAGQEVAAVSEEDDPSSWGV